MSKRHLITATLAATAAAVTLTACGNSSTTAASTSQSPTTSGSSMSGGAMSSMSAMPAGAAGGSASVQAGAPAVGPHNAADVAFATDMIPHHAQALQMATMALTEAQSPKVKALAQMIDNEQTPEIAAMTGWLKGWGKPVPSTSMGGMNMGGMTMGGASMPGMMSSGDMTKLGAASGAAFDKLFLTQMITHHTGAVTMANTELAAGQNGDATTLARSIISGQSREITLMNTLLSTIS